MSYQRQYMAYIYCQVAKKQQQMSETQTSAVKIQFFK